MIIKDTNEIDPENGVIVCATDLLSYIFQCHSTELIQFLDIRSIKTFTLLNRKMSKIALITIQSIQDNIWFDINSSSCGEIIKLNMYTPSRLLIQHHQRLHPDQYSLVTHITFGKHFNSVVDHLPTFLTHITFGDMFDQTVDNLPETITHIRFGFWFNRSIEKLPLQTRHISFGCYFDQTVDNLPQKLEQIEFGHNFNQKVNNLPSSLRYITFGHRFYQNLDKLPVSIIHIGRIIIDFDENLATLHEKLYLYHPLSEIECVYCL